MIRNLLKYAIGAALLALTGWTAFALTVDQTRNTVARVNSTQQTSYYRITVNFNDPNISTGQKFGQLLKNTYISKLACNTTTAFNGTTNTLQLGSSTVGAAATSVNWGVANATEGGTNMLIGTAGYQEASPTNSTTLGVSITSQSDVDLWARYVSTGTPTAGAVSCVIEFIPNNDM